MKSKWFAFGCLTSVLVVVVIIVLSVVSIGTLGKSFSDKDKFAEIKKDSYLQIDLTGSMSDYNEFKKSFFSKKKTSMHSIIEKINKAAYDKNIKGILLEPKFLQCGFANVNEISNALKHFQKQNKKVIAYIDVALDKDYILASVADEIYLNPSASGGIYLTGIGGSSLFYKDLLDNIGVDIEVIHAGKYKGAGENFSKNQYSKPVKDNLEPLFTELYHKILNKIATNRKISFEQIKHVYEERDELSIDNETALEYDLVDELIFRDELLEKLNIKEDKLVSLTKYSIPKRKEKDNNVAVVYANGPIAPSSSIYGMENLSASRIGKTLENVRKDKSVQAVVIRVNSPGGSALESEIILNKIKKLRNTKPVVISMGNVAASGGYYISVESDHVVADPYTITGSIGVVAMIPNAYDLTKKVGVNSDRISRGKFVDMFNLYTKPDQDQYDALKNDIEDTYKEFKTRVAEGREIPFDKVEAVAQGQVWSSKKALHNNLIDKIGLLNDAVIEAAKLASIADYSIKFFPKKKSMFEELIKEKFDLDIASELVKNDLFNELELNRLIQLLQNVKNDPIQAIMPFEIE